MKKILSAVVMSLFVLSSSTLYAQEKKLGHKKMNSHKRMVNQKKRIQQGEKSGELTPAEAAKLKAQQKAIATQRKEMKADGEFSKEERKEIRKKQRRASKNIKRKKHNKKKM